MNDLPIKIKKEKRHFFSTSAARVLMHAGADFGAFQTKGLRLLFLENIHLGSHLKLTASRKFKCHINRFKRNFAAII